MTACPARLADGPLTCQRPDAHDPHHGCVYVSSSVPDRGEG